MRVLSIPHAYAPVRGGAEHYVQSVCEELAARGHTVGVLVAAMASPEAFYSFGVPRLSEPAVESLHGVEVNRIRYGGFSYRMSARLLRLLPTTKRDGVGRRLQRRYRADFTRKLAREIDRFRPDAVLTLPHLFTNVRCVLDLQRETGFPLVVVPLLHEDDPYWPFEEMRIALSQAGAVVAMTDNEAGRLVERYGVDEARIFTCPGGIDVAPTDETDRTDMVLYLGRKSASKGIDHLTDAMRTVWHAHPNAELVLAGRVEPGVDPFGFIGGLSPLEQTRVTVLDDVSDADRDALLRVARCLAVPSTNESFGLVVLEAWAHSAPVIVPDIPVFRDTVENGIDGILVAPRDSAALATAITSLLDDPDRAAAMGARGKTKVANRYTLHAAGECMEAALRHAAEHLIDAG